MTITDAMLAGWLQMYLWPMLRIGGLILAAPLISAQTVPARVRLMFALLLTLALAPLLPAPAPVAMLSGDWWRAIGSEMLIGIGMGVILQLLFEGALLAGEMISMGMGLGFAQQIDPLHGASAPMIGQFYQLCAALLFFTLGGFLHLVELLMHSFQAIPPGTAHVSVASLAALPAFGGVIFVGALKIALPAVVTLLLVNLAFGVMNRSAPALNMLSIGFPLSIAVGMVALRFTLPQLLDVLNQLLGPIWRFALDWAAAQGQA